MAGAAGARRGTAARVAAALLAAAGLAAAAGSGRAPTRADLESARRRVDRLESEAALASTRKPYLVLDLEGRTLVYRLMGMTLREIPLADASADGLRPAPGGPAPPLSTAAVVTLQEKAGDPRLSPLTPEQIEAGADDENAADALPPDPPTTYLLSFRQPVTIRIAGVAGRAGIGGRLAALRAALGGLFGSGGATAGRRALAIDLRVEEETAREIYRSLVPGERWLILPPAGTILPEAGQEAPRDIRPARPAPRPTPPPPSPPGGVPFQIPPPVPNEGAPSAGEATPAPNATPAAPPEEAPVPAERLPDEPRPAPSPAEPPPA